MATAGRFRQSDSHRLEIAFIAAVTLLGLALRLRLIGNSLFGDELSTYSIVTGHSPAAIVRTLDGHSVDLTPPLYFLLAWLAERLGSSPELLRLFSCAAGVATIPATYLLGRRTLGRRSAATGAVLVSLSPMLIFYSSEARAYALVMFLVLASTLALLEALRTNRPAWWAAYALLQCAAVYSQYTAVFALVAQLIWAVIAHPQRARWALLASLASAAAFSPWLPVVAKNTTSFGTTVFQIIEPFGWAAISHDVSHWMIGHPYLTLSAEPGAIAIGLIAAGTLGGAVGGLLARSPSPRRWAEPLLPLVLALATPVGLAAYSALGTSTWDLRNLISSWPGFALVLGALASAPPARWRIVTVGLVLAGFAVGAGKLMSPADQRPDYAAAAAFVLAQGARTDPVAIIPAPTPGPYAGPDAAFAFAGDPRRPLLRVGAPSLDAVLRAPPYAALPATPTSTLVASTVRSPSDGRLFVITPGTAGIDALLHSGAVDTARVLGPVFGSGPTGALLGTVFPPLSAYLRAISSRFEWVRTIRLPGFLRLSVYEFRARRTP